MDECKKGGNHSWVEVAILGEGFRETRFRCEKCEEVRIVRNPYDKPKRRFFLVTWKDWFKSAEHTGSVKI